MHKETAMKLIYIVLNYIMKKESEPENRAGFVVLALEILNVKVEMG